jgi:hypothetical protein
MDKSFAEKIAESLLLDPSDVDAVLNEFALQLHRRLFEYRGINGDYVGEQLHYDLSPQAFYHLLGFLECFRERYNWEPGMATEYLARLGQRKDWLPYRHQVESWIAPPK